METPAELILILGLCCCIKCLALNTHTLSRNCVCVFGTECAQAKQTFFPSFPSFPPLSPSLFLLVLLPFFLSLHLFLPQTVCLSAALCSKLAPALYPAVVTTPSTKDVKINRSGGKEEVEEIEECKWLTMELLSAATCPWKWRKRKEEEEGGSKKKVEDG